MSVIGEPGEAGSRSFRLLPHLHRTSTERATNVAGPCLTLSHMSEVSTISKFSRRMEETGELLERAIGVMFLAAALVVIPCVLALLAAGTFAVLHNGNDFDFGGGSGSRSGGEGDIIVLPTQLF